MNEISTGEKKINKQKFDINISETPCIINDIISNKCRVGSICDTSRYLVSVPPPDKYGTRPFFR